MVGAGCYQPRGKDFVNIEIKNTFANIKLNKDNSKFYPNNNRFLTQIYNFAQKKRRHTALPSCPNNIRMLFKCHSTIRRIEMTKSVNHYFNRCFYVLDVTGFHFNWIPLHRPSNTFASARFTQEWYPANNSLHYHVILSIKSLYFNNRLRP